MKLKRTMPIYQQIILQIEEMIKKGEIKPGSRMPSTFDFASQFNIANQTAQNALKELTDRGVLKRIPKKGTFVSESFSSGTIAMLSEKNLFSEQEMAFSRLFCASAFNYAEVNGWTLKLYFPHKKDDLFKTVADLEKDINDNKIRAVFGLHANELNEWFKKQCQVPYIRFKEPDLAPTMEYFTYEGLKYLHNSGYSRIALIAPGVSLHKNFEKEIRRGISQVENEISGKLELSLWKTNGSSSGSGKTLIHEKLNSPSNVPEAFLILDDVIAGGVLFALQEKNIRIPEQVAVLTLAVKGVELLSPVSLTRLEYDPAELAKKSFDQLFNKLNGEKKSAPIQYYPSLVVGKSCGE